MMKKVSYILMLLGLVACEKQVDWPLQENKVRPLVVDGILTDEDKVQQFSLHYPVDSLNGIPEPVSGALLRIGSIDTTLLFTETSPGIYESPVPVSPPPHRTYKLFIHHGEKQYEALAYMKEGRQFLPLIYGQAGINNWYEVKWVSPDYRFADPAMYVLEMDWSHLPLYSDSAPEAGRAKAWYYALPTLDASRIFAPAQEKLFFPRGTVIIEKRYALTQEYAAYIRALLLETTWTGGMLDPEHANLPTNLSEGAIGYFAACGVTTDTIVVD